MTGNYENSPGLLCKSDVRLPEELTCVVAGETKMASVWEALSCFPSELSCDPTHTLPVLVPVLNSECMTLCKSRGIVRP